MNTAVRKVSDSIITPKRLLTLMTNKSQMLFIVLLSAVVLSALSVIYATNEARMMNTELQRAQNHQTELNTQWGQLLLEKSSWKSQTFVAQVAKNHLHMVVPSNKHYILV